MSRRNLPHTTLQSKRESTREAYLALDSLRKFTLANLRKSAKFESRGDERLARELRLAERLFRMRLLKILREAAERSERDAA
jgi:hypothetical protein